MFKQIGGKIKTFALLLVVLSVIIPVAIIIQLMSGGSSYVLLVSIISAVVCLISWLSSLFIYGFAELIDHNKDILATNREILMALRETSCQNSQEQN